MSDRIEEYIICDHGTIDSACPYCASFADRDTTCIMMIARDASDYELPHIETTHNIQKRKSREKIFNKRQSNKPWSY